MNLKICGVAIMVWGLSAYSAASGLPDESILQRFGVSADQLPKSPEPAPAEAAVVDSLFRIEAEKPLITFRPSKEIKPAPTGNPSVDRLIARDFERCRKAGMSELVCGSGHIFQDDSDSYTVGE
ncbi:hypothetical protein ACMSI6_26625 [Pseudomonas antarctica]|uniref:hypothetical protein n=1 Tax=Pseudomonas TaxID=286 RepID=UPI00387AEA5A